MGAKRRALKAQPILHPLVGLRPLNTKMNSCYLSPINLSRLYIAEK